MWKINSKVPELILSLLVTTLNVNRLNSPKRQRLPESVLKTDTTTCCLQVIHFRHKDTQWKWEDGKRCSTLSNQESTAVAVPISDHTDFNQNTYKRQRDCILIKEVKSTKRYKNHKHIPTITRAWKYIKQTLTESRGKIVNILNGKRLKAFALRSGKTEGSQFYHCYWPLSPRLRSAAAAESARLRWRRTAERSYPASEVRGGGRECQAATLQEQPRSYPTSEVGAAAGRSYPTPEAGRSNPTSKEQLLHGRRRS